MDDSTWVHAGRQVTGAQRHLLEILAASNVAVTARVVAERMWPGSESWSNPTRRGRTVQFGQGAQMRAGTMLRDLRDAGLVHRVGTSTTRWELTAAGRVFLEAGVLRNDELRLL